MRAEDRRGDRTTYDVYLDNMPVMDAVLTSAAQRRSLLRLKAEIAKLFPELDTCSASEVTLRVTVVMMCRGWIKLAAGGRPPASPSRVLVLPEALAALSDPGIWLSTGHKERMIRLILP